MAKKLAALVPLLAVAVLASPAFADRGGGQDPGEQDQRLPNTNVDPTGVVQTVVQGGGAVDHTNPFFQNLGTNGRTCATCHVQATGWTLSPPEVQARFAATQGLDPLFHNNDGTDSPNADQSTEANRAAASSMVLSKGVIRVGIGMPAGADFTLVNVDDPYGFASASQLSLFRRPLPSTNLQVLTTVMWDGRESFPGHSLHYDLADQANGATLGHAQASQPLTTEQQNEIVDFESSLFTAQLFDNAAGDLTIAGANGGPTPLVNEPFYVGINDPLGLNPTGAPFNPVVFTDFQAWAKFENGDDRGGFGGDDDDRADARGAVARGEDLFNNHQFQITGVGGLNDKLNQPSITVTCTVCHDTPEFGNHSVGAPLNIGIAAASRRTPDMPLYTFQSNVTGEIVQVTDPGRALISGKFADIGKFKGPILRGLAARAPYFHNGSAATLLDAVNFYDTRFNIGFTDQQKSDLVAFLQTL